MVEPADDVEKSRFSAAGSAQNGDEFIGAEFERHAFQSMIDAARTGEGEAECLMACLPCMLSYGWLFQKLLQRSPAVKDTYYGALVLDYAGPGYDAACRAWAERAEVACTGLSPERAARCRAIFRACSEHELHFWEMCATPRTDI